MGAAFIRNSTEVSSSSINLQVTLSDSKDQVVTLEAQGRQEPAVFEETGLGEVRSGVGLAFHQEGEIRNPECILKCLSLVFCEDHMLCYFIPKQ